MKISSTCDLPRRPARLTDRQRRDRDADRAQRWRDKNRSRAAVPVVNRMLVDAVLLVLASQERGVGMALSKAITLAAVDGLERAGYPRDEAKAAIARRIELVQSERPSEVKAALKARAEGRPVSRGRSRTVSQPVE